MGKQGRAANNAKLAALRAEQARADRRRKIYLAGGSVGIVLLVVVALVIARMVSTGSSATGTTPLAATTVQQLTNVPASALDTVGVGTDTIFPTKIDAPALTQDGKPRVLYVGAEYCPFCAVERYAMVVALSRFGTFTNLSATHSDPSDGGQVDTISFHGATYSSSYVAFTGYETHDNVMVNGQYGTLDTMTSADTALVNKYDMPPYVPNVSAPPIPWIDFGGKAIQSGASVDRNIIQGKTQAEVAGALSDPTSDIAKTVLGSANVMTAQICALTNQQPAAVCSSAGVKAGAAKLG